MKYLYMTEDGPIQSDTEPTQEDIQALDEGVLYDIFKFENGHFIKAKAGGTDDARTIEWQVVEES